MGTPVPAHHPPRLCPRRPLLARVGTAVPILPGSPAAAIYASLLTYIHPYRPLTVPVLNFNGFPTAVHQWLVDMEGSRGETGGRRPTHPSCVPLPPLLARTTRPHTFAHTTFPPSPLPLAAAAAAVRVRVRRELGMHALAQAGRGQPAARLTYRTQPGLRLKGLQSSPLLLALSRGPLPLGPVHKGAAKQLVSSFAWDEDSADAHFLLPSDALAQCGAWHVTLCAAVEGRGLLAVSPSARLDALPAAAAAAAPGTATGTSAQQPAARPPWRALPGPPRLGELDVGLVARVAGRAASQEQQQQPGVGVGGAPAAGCWRAAVHADGSGVTVDVEAPGPLPAEGDGIAAEVVAGRLVVSLGPRQRREAGWPDMPPVELPPGVAEGAPAAAKVSRKLGLMSVRLALARPA
jgi:hypothetical protein